MNNNPIWPTRHLNSILIIPSNWTKITSFSIAVLMRYKVVFADVIDSWKSRESQPSLAIVTSLTHPPYTPSIGANQSAPSLVVRNPSIFRNGNLRIWGGRIWGRNQNLLHRKRVKMYCPLDKTNQYIHERGPWLLYNSFYQESYTEYRF